MFGYLTGLVKKHACQWRWISLQTIVPLQVENLFETALFLSVLVKNFLKGEQEEGAGRFLLRILYSVKFCWHLGQLPYSPDIPLYYWQITQHIGVANSPVSEKHISRAANDPSVFTITVHREGASNQENSLVGSFTMIVKPMDRLHLYIFAWPLPAAWSRQSE